MQPFINLSLSSRVHVSCKRLGGAFGGKIDQVNIVSTAAAVAAYKTRQPVRVQLDLGDNMTIIGGREPYLCTYKVPISLTHSFTNSLTWNLVPKGTL